MKNAFENEYLVAKSASIQKITSPLEFDYFRMPKPDFTAPDLSTKALRAGPSARGEDAGARAETREPRSRGLARYSAPHYPWMAVEHSIYSDRLLESLHQILNFLITYQHFKAF